MGVASLAICLLSAGSGHGQLLLSPNHSLVWNAHARSWPQHRPRSKEFELAKKNLANSALKGPLQIIISVADQRLSLYDNGVLVARSSVSTGMQGHQTPVGVFSVISKHRWHRSNLYSDAPMPYMQRITWSGIALHAGIVPGYPASHGCIRLNNEFALRLWHLTKRGTRVIIARDEVHPVEVASPQLFAPKSKVSLDSSETPANVMPDDGSGSQTKAAASDPGMPKAENPGESAQVADPPAGAAPGKAAPISIFVSRKEGKLYVRQTSIPVLEAPVTIENPEQPLGTHVFTAMEFTNEGTAMRWTVVSMPRQIPRQAGGRRQDAKHFPGKASASASLEGVLAPPGKAALDRIKIPSEVAERISELLTPGASLIVSDSGVSEETGEDTDFIILTH